MISNMEVADLFMRRLWESAIVPDNYVPLLSKHLKGYVPDGQQTGIACGKYPARVDQYTEIKIIHSVTVKYNRPDVKNNPGGSTAVNKFQGQVRRTYLFNLHKKDVTHFGTAEVGAVGPLEAIFMQVDFKPLVFGTFSESSSNVREFIDTAVEYGVEHMGRTIAATTVDAVRMALKRRYRTQPAMAAWKGYANLVITRTKYVGTGITGHNKARVRQEMIAREDASEFMGMWMAHETDEPLRDAFPNGWGDIGGGRFRRGLDT
jgi:hypothetical protein